MKLPLAAIADMQASAAPVAEPAKIPSLPESEIPKPPVLRVTDWNPAQYQEERQVQAELPVGAQVLWGVPGVLAALVAHEAGSFGSSSLLWEAMTQDPRIKSSLDKRTRAIVGSEIVFEPADRSAKAQKIAEEVAENWVFWISESEAESLHRWIIGMGFGIAQILPDYENDWVPTVNVWHPQNIYWFWDIQRLFGRWQLVTGSNPNIVEPLGGDGQWIFPQTTWKYSWMNGLIRCLALRYIGRWDVFKSWARQCEKFGLAFVKILAPINASPIDIAKIEAQMRRLGSEPQLTLRQGMEGNKWDAKFEEVNQQGFLTFQKFFEVAADEIHIAIGGETLTTQVRTGSRAAAQVHNEIRQDVKEADAKMLATMWRAQFLRPWCQQKYDDWRLAPKMYYSVAPSKDMGMRAKTYVDLGAALTSFRALQLPVDEKTLLTQFEVPLTDDAVQVSPEGAAVDPAEAAGKRKKPVRPNDAMVYAVHNGRVTCRRDFATDPNIHFGVPEERGPMWSQPVMQTQATGGEP